MTEQNVVLGNYLLGDQIADESTTEIYEAYHRDTGELCAIKLPKKGCLQIAQELECFRQISHDYIISPKEVLDTPNGPALVLPYARGGDLYGWIAGSPLSEDCAKRLTFYLLNALEYLHHQNFWHRDIKTENILVMDDCFSSESIVLSDFGYCKKFDKGVCDNEFCGSPHYSAPELFMGRPYTEKVDIWALGITLYGCLTSAMPYEAEDRASMVRDIVDGLPDLFRLRSLEDLSEQCRDFLDWLLTADPEKRPSAEDALAHPWFIEMWDTKGTEFGMEPTEMANQIEPLEMTMTA
jgi:serine/threonine protein kinase